MKLDGVQNDLMSVLLGRIFSQGLLSEAAYKSAQNALASAPALPDLFASPARPAEEAAGHGAS